MTGRRGGRPSRVSLSLLYLPLFELQPTVEGLGLEFGILLSFLLAWFVAGNVGRGSKSTTVTATAGA